MRLTARGAAVSVAAYSLATAPAVSLAISHSSQPVAPPAGEAAWTEEWEALAAAARAEGKLSLLTLVGRGYRQVIDGFEQAFPGIVVDWLAESSPGVWLNQVRQERRAGIYSFDLALVPPTRALVEGRAESIWSPIRPLLFHPDVLDDSAWRDGLSARFMDTGGDLSFDWEYQVVHAYAINTDLVAEGEISTVQDLLDPKWKGKILSSDPRVGTGLLSAASVAKSWGTDVLRQLLVDQRPTISRGGLSEVTEPLVRGHHPIALGVRPKSLKEFRDQGLGDRVKFLDLADADFAATISIFAFDRAPHPAAARLFANWILTRDGQTLLTSSLPTNSARTDVDVFEPDGIATPGKHYFEPDKEANYRHIAETQKLVRDLLGLVT